MDSSAGQRQGPGGKLASARSGRAAAPPRLRWQLPVYSPLSLRALGAASRAVIQGADPRMSLARSIGAEFDSSVVRLCGSGTDALQRGIRLAAARVGRRAAVALPAYSCFDLASAAIGTDLPIVLYDLDPDTLGPDLDSLRHALAAGARVVVISPLYGMPVDWAEIEALTKPAGALLIEDAAQGQGASWRGRSLGSLGPISVLSFGRGKGWTGGRGGALLVRWDGAVEDDTPVLGPAGDLSILLSTAVQWAVGRPTCYGIPASLPWLGLGETHYRAPEPAREMARAAAVLIESTRGIAWEAAAARRAAAEAFLRRIPGVGVLRPIVPVAGAAPGYLRFPLRISGGAAALANSTQARKLGIAPGYPRPLNELTALYGRLVKGGRRWPGAESLVRELITLPTHMLVSDDDRERIIQFLAGGSGHGPGADTRFD